MKALGVALALLVAACGEMAPSPVAPSATAPPIASGPVAPAPRAPVFGISLDANGGQAYVGQPWTSTLAVDSSVPSAGPPASVQVQCGSDAPQVFAGFLGLRIVGCTFVDLGPHVVTAAVIAPNAVTTTRTVTVTAVTAPVVTQPALFFNLNATRISGTDTSAEWRFTIVASEPMTDIVWDFGDGSGSSSGRTVEQHRYTKEGSTTIRVFATSATHGPAQARAEIEVKFN